MTFHCMMIGCKGVRIVWDPDHVDRLSTGRLGDVPLLLKLLRLGRIYCGDCVTVAVKSHWE